VRQLDQLVEAARDAGRLPAEVARRERDIVFRGQVREEPALLDDVAHAPPQRTDRHRIDRLAPEENLALARPCESRDQAQERGLAAAGGSQEDAGAGAERQRRRLQRRHTVVALHDAAQLDDGSGVHPRVIRGA
jgi:hypothetical protein